MPHLRPCPRPAPYLGPLSFAAAHVDGGDVLKELLSGGGVWQAGEELGHVDEVQLDQCLLVEAQQA